MSAKTFKKIRQSLRVKGVDWNDVAYDVSRGSKWFFGHVKLRQTCGRFAYKLAKHGVKAAGVTA